MYHHWLTKTMKLKLIPIILCTILFLAATLIILTSTDELLIRIMPLGDSITQGDSGLIHSEDYCGNF